MSVSLADQIKCAKRELALRQNVYPKWVESGRMKADAAIHEIAGMQAIVDTLEAIAAPQAAQP